MASDPSFARNRRAANRVAKLADRGRAMRKTVFQDVTKPNALKNASSSARSEIRLSKTIPRGYYAAKSAGPAAASPRSTAKSTGFPATSGKGGGIQGPKMAKQYGPKQQRKRGGAGSSAGASGGGSP